MEWKTKKGNERVSLARLKARASSGREIDPIREPVEQI